MARRSTQMLVLGLAVFVIGAGVVILTLSGGDGGSQNAAATSTTTVQAGTVVIPSGAPLPTSFTIPDGKQAVAVQVPFVAGLAGYARAGDLVNVYAAIEKGQIAPDVAPPQVKLVLPAVQVLAVTGPPPGTAEAGNATYLLALDAVQAEQAIFLARFESVWMTLAPKGQPTPSTPGRSYKNAL